MRFPFSSFSYTIGSRIDFCLYEYVSIYAGESSLPCSTCGTQCVLRTANTENNRGRKFYSCPSQGCNFFVYVNVKRYINDTRLDGCQTGSYGTPLSVLFSFWFWTVHFFFFFFLTWKVQVQFFTLCENILFSLILCARMKNMAWIDKML